MFVSVAGNGSSTGAGGGKVRLGQLQVLVAEPDMLTCPISPIVGKSSLIMSKEVQASRLKNSLSQLSVIYTICLVSNLFPDLAGPDSLTLAAPNILIGCLFAACIRD